MQQQGAGKSSPLFTSISPGSNFLSCAARKTREYSPPKNRSRSPSCASANRFHGIFPAHAPPRSSRSPCLPLYAVDFGSHPPGSIPLRSPVPLHPLSPHCSSCEFCALVWVCVRIKGFGKSGDGFFKHGGGSFCFLSLSFHFSRCLSFQCGTCSSSTPRTHNRPARILCDTVTPVEHYAQQPVAVLDFCKLPHGKARMFSLVKKITEHVTLILKMLIWRNKRDLIVKLIKINHTMNILNIIKSSLEDIYCTPRCLIMT